MAFRLTRRQALRLGGAAVAGGAVRSMLRAASAARPARDFEAREFGARGDGIALDSPAIQRAIDAAAAYGPGGRVVVRGGRRYRVGPMVLRAGVELHLADDAELTVSSDPRDYAGAPVISAVDAPGIRLTGTGSIDGRSPDFMASYDAVNEWWRPKRFRPRLVALTGCRDLEIRDLTLKRAPSWTIHLLGCEHGLIRNVTIRNQLDVPNCDGIDPDHCRDLEIAGCRIACGDDAIVLKTTRAGAARYGGSSRVRVSDCVIETQDSGVKIGTETVSDIHDVRFERCEIRTSSRGCTIQLRDEGNIAGVQFRDITLVARCHANPWWGRGEVLSFTAFPRAPGAPVGRLSGIRVQNVTGRAENSARVCGCDRSRVTDVQFTNVDLTLDRWTRYPGGVWDNRPTTAVPGIEPHDTPAYGVRFADGVTWTNCAVRWGANLPPSFGPLLEADHATALDYRGLRGRAAHPGQEAIVLRS